MGFNKWMRRSSRKQIATIRFQPLEACRHLFTTCVHQSDITATFSTQMEKQLLIQLGCVRPAVQFLRHTR